jgi:hypothetical protein
MPLIKPPETQLKLIALLASIGGAVSFTILAAGFGWVLWRGGWPSSTAEARIDWLGWSLLLIAAGSIVATLSLGFVITPRRFRIGKNGLEGSGGDDNGGRNDGKDIE